MLGILLATATAAYWPSLAGPRILDDMWLPDLFNSSISNLKWWRPETRPFLTFSFILQGMWLGESNSVSRLVNVAILVCSAMLLFELLNRSLRRAQPSLAESIPLLSAFIAFAWALHPLQTQSIAYIIQRAESLMGMFFFAFLLCLLLDQEQHEGHLRNKGSDPGSPLELFWRHHWKLLAVSCFILGIWSKTIMLTGILVGPLFDRAILSTSWRDVWRARGSIYVIPVAASALAMALLLPGIMVGAANVGFGGNAPPASLYLAAQAQVLWQYLGQILLPNQLNIDWGIAPPAYVAEMWPWIAFTSMLLIAIAVASISGRWKTVLLLSGPVIVLLPTSSFIPTADLRVEHRLYVPSAIVIAGIAIAVWNSLNQLSATKSNQHRITAMVAIAVLLAFCARTWLRCCDYQSAFRIWSQSVLVNPSNNRAIQSAIDAADIENRQDEVIPLLLSGIAILERRGKLPLVPLQRLGETLGKLGEHEKAVATLEKSIEFDEQERAATPGGYRDIQRQLNRAASHVNLAIAQQALGQTDVALGHIEQAIHFAPEALMPRAIAGQLYREAGLLSESLEHFEEAAEIDPTSEEIRDDIAALRGHILSLNK